jgi:hypothetical protein
MAGMRAIPVSGVGFQSCNTRSGERTVSCGQMDGQGNRERAGVCADFCEWGGVLELVTHVCKSMCVFLGGRAMTVNEFLARYNSIRGEEVAEVPFSQKNA